MKYTHTDSSGMRWRFDGSRPVSEVADRLMAMIPKGEPKNITCKKVKLKKIKP